MRKKKKYPADYITAAAAIVWAASVSAIDTESWIPFAACVLSTLWLGLYVHVQNRKERSHG
jgi:hypothetical protein